MENSHFQPASRLNKEKFDLILDLPTEESLHDSYKSIWGTVAIVAALFLATFASDGNYSLNIHPDNLWGSYDYVGLNLFHLFVGLSIQFSLLAVLVCVWLSVQLSHVPKENTSQLLREIGNFVQIPQGAMVVVMVSLFALTLSLQFTLAFTTWVALVLLVFMAGGLVLTLYMAQSAMDAKMKVLRDIKALADSAKTDVDDVTS